MLFGDTLMLFSAPFFFFQQFWFISTSSHGEVEPSRNMGLYEDRVPHGPPKSGQCLA